MHSPYLLIPICIFALLFYTFSYVLVKLGLWHISAHRKVWNILLLITFLVTAVLGLLLVIQINFKLEWKFVESIIKWHVDFGIAMSIVAAFHFTWHWHYYLNLFNGKPTFRNGRNDTDLPLKNTESQLMYLVILSGFIATVIQVLFIREITTVFQGNELMMTWTLGIWMFLIGIGAFIGRKRNLLYSNTSLVSGIIFILSLMPLILVPLLSILKNSLFPPGILVGPISFLLVIIILLFPVCLLSGITYAKLVHLVKSKENDFIKVYGFEAIGSLIGGVCVSFIMVQWFSIMESFFLLVVVTNCLLFFLRKKLVNAITGSLCLFLLILFYFYPVDEKIKSFLFVNQRVVESMETNYGNLTVSENAGQYNFYENGNLLFTSENTIVSEEYVHYALLQHNNPQHVLLVSGGISGMIKEILKYSEVQGIDYIELNPGLFKLAAKYAPLPTDKRINVIKGDARRYINRNVGKYDVAIMALPDPSSMQVNRLYSENFIEKLKQRLNLGGVVIFGISPSGNYMSESKLQMEAAMYNTLKNSFANVGIIPGERDYFLASDSEISIAITQLYKRNSIDNIYVNDYYIDDVSIKQRSNTILRNISGKSIVNSDNKPQPVFLYSAHFLSQFNTKWWLILVLPLILLIIPFFGLKAASQSVYLAGFTAASVEILLIFSFQVVFGYIYSAIGIIIAIFMGGLALGALFSRNKTIVLKHLIFSQLMLVIYSLLFMVVWICIDHINNSILLWLLFILLTLIPSALTGFIYVAGTKMTSLQLSEAAPLNYSVDLLGSALGVLFYSVIILPLVGIQLGCLILAGVNMLGVLLNKPFRAL